MEHSRSFWGTGPIPLSRLRRYPGPQAAQAEGASHTSREAAVAEDTVPVWVTAYRLAPVSPESECRPGSFTAGPLVEMLKTGILSSAQVPWDSGLARSQLPRPGHSGSQPAEAGCHHQDELSL